MTDTDQEKVDHIYRAPRGKYKLFSIKEKKGLKRSLSPKIRVDVIYKTILRDMKKFFTNDFNKEINFISRTRRANRQFYVDCLKEYISIRFPE